MAINPLDRPFTAAEEYDFVQRFHCLFDRTPMAELRRRYREVMLEDAVYMARSADPNAPTDMNRVRAILQTNRMKPGD
jgi:uncharacterized protein YchJ